MKKTLIILTAVLLAAGLGLAQDASPTPAASGTDSKARAEAQISDAAQAVAALEAKASSAPTDSGFLARLKERLDSARKAFDTGNYGDAYGLARSVQAMTTGGPRTSGGPGERTDQHPGSPGANATGGRTPWFVPSFGEQRRMAFEANATAAMERSKEHFGRFQEFREKYREAQRGGGEKALADSCGPALLEAKEVLRATQDQLTAKMSEVGAMAETGNASLSAEVQASVKSDLAGAQSSLKAAIDSIPENVTTAAQCREAVQKLREVVETFRAKIRDLQARYRLNACLGLAVRTNALLSNLGRYLDRLEQQGVDVKDLRAKIADAQAKAAELVQKCRAISGPGASEMFQASTDLLKEIKASLLEVVSSIRASATASATPDASPAAT